jgi:hypothetical protein
LKIRIKQLESFLNVWLQLERCLNELHLKFSKLSDNMNNNYSPSFRQSFLNYHTDEAKLVDQLNDVKSSINEYKLRLDSFKDQIIQQNSLQITPSSSIDQFSIHESYLLKLDKFVHKFNNLIDTINQTNTQNLNKFTSTTNLTSSKTNHSHHHNFHQHKTSNKNNNNNLLTSIHLDDLNRHTESHDVDYLDDINFQMTSTPRYHITNSSSLLSSSSGNFKNILNSGSAVTTVSTSSGTNSLVNKFQLPINIKKTYADKSISTIDDKSTQTENDTSSENKKHQDQQHTLSLTTHRSLDSGIMNVTIGSDVGSISSASPMSKSFNINTNKLTRNNELHSQSLPQVSKLNRKFDKGISFESIANAECLVKKSNSSQNEECIIKNYKSQIEEINLIKREEEKIESEIEINVKNMVEKCPPTPTTTTTTNKKSNIECCKKKVSSSFSFTKFLCYSLFFFMLVCLLVINFLPLALPSCCDYRRDFLIFNSKKQDDDHYLPF